MVVIQHLTSPASLPTVPSNIIDNSISVVSWNILLPNSNDGWWTYKMYYPPLCTEEEKIRASWQYRQQLIKQRIATINADVVCFQEVAPISFENDFDFMWKELGYTGHVIYKKGRFRPVTFWKDSILELMSNPVHKDRVLVTAFRRRKIPLVEETTNDDNNQQQQPDDEIDNTNKIKKLKLCSTEPATGPVIVVDNNNNKNKNNKDTNMNPFWYVVNCHLQAGKQGSRRLRQIHEGVNSALIMGKKLQPALYGANKYEVAVDIGVIVCGDFNGDTECGAVRLLEDGFVPATFQEDNESITSRNKDNPLRYPLIDVAAAVERPNNTKPPATMVVTELISLLVQPKETKKENDDINHDDDDEKNNNDTTTAENTNMDDPDETNHTNTTTTTNNNDNVSHATSSGAASGYDNPQLSDDVKERLERIYNRFATGPDGAMILKDVEKWLCTINGQVGRGDEYRAAVKYMTASIISPPSTDETVTTDPRPNNATTTTTTDNDDGTRKKYTKLDYDTIKRQRTRVKVDDDDLDDNETNPKKIPSLPTDEKAVLLLNDFIQIYQEELNRGKFWGIAYDLAVLGEPLPVSTLYEGRYDRMYCSCTDRSYATSRIQIYSVVDTISTSACPNDVEPSDHLPVAATFISTTTPTPSTTNKLRTK